MSFLETPILLNTLLFGLLAVGAGVIFLPSSAVRYGRWVVSVALVALLGAVVYWWLELRHTGFEPLSLQFGWVLPREESEAITVGLRVDPLGLALTFVVATLSLLWVFVLGSVPEAGQTRRFLSALTISTAGVGICWLSLTPWYAFVGLALAAAAGFLATASKTASSEDAPRATRYASEKAWGLLLAALGACILAGSRGALAWDQALPSGSGSAETIGAWLYVTGLFLQLQSFPLMGWVALPSGIPTALKALLTQVLPALGVFAMLLRFESQLRALEILPAFGWVALASVFLTVAAGFFQQRWRQAFATWLGAGFALICAILAASGTWTALSALLGLVFGALAFSVVANHSGGWASAARFIGMAAATGTIGFVSAGGFARWGALVWQQNGAAITGQVAFFFWALLGWRLVWTSLKARAAAVPASAVVISALLLLAALGLVWTGTASGGALSDAPDVLLISLMERFGLSASEAPAETTAGLGLVMASLVFAFFGAYWTSGRKHDLWVALGQGMPRASRFIAGGYRVEWLGERLIAVLRWLSTRLEWVLQRKIAEEWLSGHGQRLAQRGVGALARVDSGVSEYFNHLVARWFNLLAKLLQIVQSGDVQWYLVLAIASCVAILLHFLRG